MWVRQEDQFGIADDAHGHVEAALLTSGQRQGLPTLLIAEPDHLDDVADRKRRRVIRGELLDHFADGQVGVGAGRLRNDADPGSPRAAVLGRITAEDPHVPLLR